MLTRGAATRLRRDHPEYHMGRTPLRMAAATTLATLFIASTATTGYAATEEVTHPVPVAGTPGHYIVVMKSDPLATYEGDVKGLKATKPAEGEQLETQSQDSQRYVEHLQTEQT